MRSSNSLECFFGFTSPRYIRQAFVATTGLGQPSPELRRAILEILAKGDCRISDTEPSPVPAKVEAVSYIKVDVDVTILPRRGGDPDRLSDTVRQAIERAFEPRALVPGWKAYVGMGRRGRLAAGLESIADIHLTDPSIASSVLKFSAKGFTDDPDGASPFDKFPVLGDVRIHWSRQ
jgi:hypothetical protein